MIESPCGLNVDAGSGKGLAQGVAQIAQIAPDRDLERCQLAAILTEDEDGGRPVRLADQKDLARGTHDGIGNRGIGDKDFLRVTRKVDDERLADRERNAPGARPLMIIDANHGAVTVRKGVRTPIRAGRIMPLRLVISSKRCRMGLNGRQE